MIDRLASSQGRNDEEPDIVLAEKLSVTEDMAGIAAIAAGLDHSDSSIVNDCIKVLYEVGKRKPFLIVSYAERFIDLLHSKNNRLVWGSMTALATIAPLAADTIFRNREKIMKAYAEGSVITVDNGISVFAGAARASSRYEKHFLPVLLHHLENCRPKEVGQHAERAFICINGSNCDAFAAILEKRCNTLALPQQKRVKHLLDLIGKKRFPQ